MSGRRRPREDPLEKWVPKTNLGRMVFEGQISSIYEIFEEGYKIKEVEIIDVLLPDLRDEVIDINLVQKQTDAGERSRFRAIVAVGNSDGLIGLGAGKAPRVRNAIEKGIRTPSTQRMGMRIRISARLKPGRRPFVRTTRNPLSHLPRPAPQNPSAIAKLRKPNAKSAK